MFDIEKERAKRRNFAMALANSFRATEGGRRDQLDVLRTAVWYSDIEHQLGGGSIYRIERILEPDAFRYKKHSYHLNKWRRYKVGADTPRAALVERVDGELPGTAALLNHPLWEALRGRKPVKRLLQEEMRRLAPAVQQVVFAGDEFGTARRKPMGPVTRVTLLKLERRAGIDALACLTILLRAAVETDLEQAFDIARSLYRVLLITCVSVPLGSWTRYIFECYRQAIFPLVNSEEHQFDFDGFDFEDAVTRLNIWLLRLEDDGVIGVSHKESVRAMWKLTTGGYGLKLWWSFEPPILWKGGTRTPDWMKDD
ncbi:MAG: hypothetical protein JNM11_04295 [Chitinimonas sp.]|nr:hypothetical protein [Chitinimonas sp.]